MLEPMSASTAFSRISQGSLYLFRGFGREWRVHVSIIGLSVVLTFDLAIFGPSPLAAQWMLLITTLALVIITAIPALIVGALNPGSNTSGANDGEIKRSIILDSFWFNRDFHGIFSRQDARIALLAYWICLAVLMISSLLFTPRTLAEPLITNLLALAILPSWSALFSRYFPAVHQLTSSNNVLAAGLTLFGIVLAYQVASMSTIFILAAGPAFRAISVLRTRALLTIFPYRARDVMITLASIPAIEHYASPQRAVLEILGSPSSLFSLSYLDSTLGYFRRDDVLAAVKSGNFSTLASLAHRDLVQISSAARLPRLLELATDNGLVLVEQAGQPVGIVDLESLGDSLSLIPHLPLRGPFQPSREVSAQVKAEKHDRPVR